MTFPIVWHQDPPQVRVPFETNPEQIEILALVPIRRRPYGRNRRRRGIASRHANFQAHALATVQRKKVIIHFEARLDRKAVHRGYVREKGKAKRGLGDEVFSGASQMFARDDDRCFPSKFQHLGDRLSVPFPQFAHNRIFVFFLRFHDVHDSQER